MRRNALNDQSHTSTVKVVMYATDWCPFCIRAEKLLLSKGAEIKKLNSQHYSNIPIDVQFRTASGEIRDVEIRLRLLRNQTSEVTGYTGTLQDVTERNESEKRIRFLAQHDLLTSLPNRALAFSRL